MPPHAAPESGGRRPLLELFPPARVERERPPGPILGTATGPRLPRAVARPIAPTPSVDGLGYETFYGLNEKPFSLSTDPKFLYHSNAHDRAAQDLLTAIRRRDGLVILTGPLGAGKTTVCRAVTEQLDRRTLTSLLVDPCASVEDLLQTVLVDFGVMSREDLTAGPLANREELGSTLQSFLDSLASLQASAVVLVDDAHNLPVAVLDALRTLSDAGGGALRLLQIVLIGQPALTAMLRRPELRALELGVSVRCEVGPLVPDEIAGYVMHRLAVAGSSPRVEFDDAAAARLYELTGGLPRSVNILCDRALALGFQASASVIDASMVSGAAEDLDITPPVVEASGAMQMIVAVVAFVALILAGAGGAAWVFRHDVARAVAQWEHVPAMPSEPARTLPGLVPISPLPIPAEAVSPQRRRF